MPREASAIKTWWRMLVPLAIGVIILIIPVPAGLTPAAWQFFALFAAVVAALVLEPFPGAVVGLAGVTLAAAAGLVEAKPGDAIRWALSGFTDLTVWLIFVAFMFALGYERTGLGRRVSLGLVKLLGRRTLGLGYATTLSDLALAPFMPSNTARSGGTIYPVARNIPTLYGSEPGETSRKMGSYIMWTAFAGQAVTSSMFLTGLAPNVLAVGLIAETIGLNITWSEWFVGFLPIGLLLIATLPLIIYKLYPPIIKASEEVPTWAGKELQKLGRLSVREITMLVLALLALGLWIFARDQINATTVALVAFALMLLTRVVTWDDVLGNRPAWNALVWFATLVAMAGGLSRVGFVAWFADGVAAALGGVPVILMAGILVAIFFIVHYMFASITAHAVALLPVFLGVGAAIPDFPLKPYALLLAYSLGLMGVLTPYATGPAPVYYGSGYVGRRDFWLLGLIFGAIFLALLLGIGMPYLLALHG
ncbi:MAG TPA: DASS family sodium-coupled anion symporter [Bacillota bacterium]|nr:DASS family sodium-coupled anion symporter [Bacillota bacterium]